MFVFFNFIFGRILRTIRLSTINGESYLIFNGFENDTLFSIPVSKNKRPEIEYQMTEFFYNQALENENVEKALAMENKFYHNLNMMGDENHRVRLKDIGVKDDITDEYEVFTIDENGGRIFKVEVEV